MKKILSVFMSFLMAFSIIFPVSKADAEKKKDIIYGTEQVLSDDKSSVEIKLDLSTVDDTISIKNIIMPDQTEKKYEKTKDISYKVDENGRYRFVVIYEKEDITADDENDALESETNNEKTKEEEQNKETQIDNLPNDKEETETIKEDEKLEESEHGDSNTEQTNYENDSADNAENKVDSLNENNSEYDTNKTSEEDKSVISIEKQAPNKESEKITTKEDNKDTKEKESIQKVEKQEIIYVDVNSLGEKWSLTINYRLNSDDGSMINTPYKGEFKKGETYEVTSPEIKGFKLKDESQKKITGSIDKDTVINVIYNYTSQETTKYTIKCIDQDTGKEITEPVEEKISLIDGDDKEISVSVPYIEGYHLADGQNTTLVVTPDGKAVKIFEYTKNDRPYIIFNTQTEATMSDGSEQKIETQASYVAPIVAEPGEDISDMISEVASPTAQGYEFAGWDQKLPSTMPDSDLIINAKWEAGESEYTVLYWFENADDNDYELDKEYQMASNIEVRKGITGVDVTATPNDIANGENQEDTSRNKFYGFDYSHCEDTTIKADGTSVLNIYYKREIWKINYMEKPEGGNIWRTIEGKYMSKIGDKLISDEELKEYYGDNFAYMAKSKEGSDAAMMERFENSKSATTEYGEQNIFPYYSGNTYKYQIRQFADNPNDYFGGNLLLINTSYIYYAKDYVSGLRLFPPDGFQWDGGKWKTSNTENGINSKKYNETNPNGEGNDGKAIFRGNPYILQYMDIQMTRIKSTLNYVSNGEMIQGITNVPYGKNIDLSVVPKNGEPNMIFAGWYTNPVLMNDKDPLESYTMPANDLTLYAKWVPVDMTVEFDSMGGSEVPSQTVKYNTKATIPEEPTKEGYQFVGWYTSPEYETRWSFDRTIEKDTILYAKWVKKYTVTYKVEHILEKSNDDGSISNVTFKSVYKTGIANTTINEDALDIEDSLYPKDSYFKPGYESKSLTLSTNEDSNVIKFYYKDMEKKEYTVSYRDADTGRDLCGLIDEKNTHDENEACERYLTLDSRVIVNAKEIKGYDLVSDEQISRELGSRSFVNGEVVIPDSNKIVFMYEKEGTNPPVDPEEPDKPVDPEEPDKPVDPEEPDKPVDPEEPDKPVDPEEPDKPVDPEEPDKPVDPEEPDKPVDPEEPDKPVDPEEPDKPVDPEEPDKPVDPEEPDKPVDPEEPDKPVDPEDSNIPENNEVQDSPKTGDTGIYIYTVVLLSSGAIFIFMNRRKKFKEKI
ncbi:hypothetical protein EXD82_09835 [Peptacetobacter hominis]|uniref:LPXTG cell wall anchor domain-containing protein n=1 Tax=Peptacetobacter hominis TaxID=2743610 RepID=A0A544QT19_9FIRM|nr:InlB B-repeat-containing protein [Peptacetobacter hominis]TQQ83187.1 hypothetical protein EXD82_09835 [Peptacetobacter hominis]